MGLPAVAIAASVLSAGVGAYGAIESGQAQAAAANYQAQIARNNAVISQQNAAYATQAGQAQETAARLKTAAQLGAIRAVGASHGLDVNSGSELSLQTSADELGDVNALTIRNNAALQARAYRNQASGYQAQAGLETAQAGADQTAGLIGAGGSILGGASSVASKWTLYKQLGLLGGSAPGGLSLGGAADPLGFAE